MNSKINYRERIAMKLVKWTQPHYVRYFKKRQTAWQKDNEALLRYPSGSLGRSLGEFLMKNDFELLPKLEDHDVLHVLLHYPTTLVGEIKMQCFLLGNRKRSFYAIFSALLGLILVPERWKSFYREFALGRQCRAVHRWNFEHLLAEPLDLLQEQVFGHPLENQPLRF